MTKHECAVIMAFTGVAMLKGNDLDIFYEYVAKILCRPVYTHEMAMLSEKIKEAARNDFVQLCRNASDEPKRGETNADRIRQMTDDELAEFLLESRSRCKLCKKQDEICEGAYHECWQGIRERLNCMKEADEDAGID